MLLIDNLIRLVYCSASTFYKSLTFSTTGVRIMDIEKFCPNCEKYGSWKGSMFRFQVRAGEWDNDDDEDYDNKGAKYCPCCATELQTREVNDTADIIQSSCSNCGKTIQRMGRFCMYCRTKNQDYKYGFTELSRCPKCDIGKTTKELREIREGLNDLCCCQCGEPLQRVDIPHVICNKCHLEISPRILYCNSCGTLNHGFKTETEIMKIFDADG